MRLLLGHVLVSYVCRCYMYTGEGALASLGHADVLEHVQGSEFRVKGLGFKV